jgi:hypothetical protein
MKTKFITITCEKYHENRVQSIRETWGKKQDVVFLSDLNISPDIIGFEYLQRGYENIWMKYVEMLKSWTDFNYDWYFFTDDDTFVNIDNINSLLSEYNTNDMVCIGIVGALNADCTDKDGQHTGFPRHTIRGKDTSLPLIYVGGGAGFILSKTSFESICEYIKNLNQCDIPGSYSSDVTFGFWMRNCGIKVVNVPGFWWTNPKELNHDVEKIKSSFTYHYIDSDYMREIFNLIYV